MVGRRAGCVRASELRASFELWRFWALDSGLAEAESCVICRGRRERERVSDGGD